MRCAAAHHAAGPPERTSSGLEQTPVRTERNMGIEALRIISMFMIVVLHVLGPGGVLNAVPVLSVRYQAAWLVEIACYCAVDCYALISGYVGRRSRFRCSRLAQLWLQMIFYTVLITAAFAVLQPGSITGLNWRNAVLPVMTQQYWYLSAYFGLFFLLPVFNAALTHLNKRSLPLLGAAIFCVYSLLPCLLQSDPFYLRSGYCMLWLCLLYVLGGVLAECGAAGRIRTRTALLGFCAAVLLTWGSKLVPEYLVLYRTGETGMSGLLVSYTSPTVLAAAVLLLLLFAQLRVSTTGRGIIARIAPAALGVYIIHVHPLVFTRCLEGRFAGLAAAPAALLLPEALGAALVIYLACTAADLLRARIFLWLKVSERLQVLEQRMRQKMGL